MAFFYADDSLLASPHLAQIQEYLDVLKVLFVRFILRTNMKKIGYDLPAMSHGRPTLVGGIWVDYYGRRPVVPGLPKGEVLMPGLLCRPDGRFNGGAPSVPAQDCLGGTLG